MKRVKLLVSFVVLFTVLATVRMAVAPSAIASEVDGSQCDCALLWKLGVYTLVGEVLQCVPQDCWVPIG